MTVGDLRAIVKRLNGMRARVEVGVPAGPREKGGSSSALVASVHEFGSPARNIPQRSFLRGGIERNLPGLIALNGANLAAIGRGQMDIETALGRLGQAAAAAVKREIIEGDFAPLKAATIKRKKSSRPLVDTGQLRQSVTYDVIVKGGG